MSVVRQPDSGIQRLCRLQTDAQEALPRSHRLGLRLHTGYVAGSALHCVGWRWWVDPPVGVEDNALTHQVEGARRGVYRSRLAASRDLQGGLSGMGRRHQTLGLDEQHDFMHVQLHSFIHYPGYRSWWCRSFTNRCVPICNSTFLNN